jgi:uncharacterized protein involved in response to NO
MARPVAGRGWTEAPLFALGFRPFYLLAGIYAAVAVPLWAAQYAGWLSGANPYQHAHEMLFGYAFAVITGFLFTAVRNWTALPTPAGASLAAIATLWVAARVVAPVSLQAAAVLDAVFAAAVAWGIGRPITTSGNRRNYFFVPLVLGLGAASLAFQAWPRQALVVGLDVVLFVIAVMGGRVIPMFTNNAIPAAGSRRIGSLERAALSSVVLLLALDALDLARAAAVVAGIAAALHAARLILWKPWRTRGQPIVWILHCSYAWIVVHLGLRALAEVGAVGGALATHALTIGAIGGMTLGMMTRTARGHTGRLLVASRAEVAAYALVQAAAAARVFLPMIEPALYSWSVLASAALWSVSFALFVAAFYPVLTRPRLDGKPG